MDYNIIYVYIGIVFYSGVFELGTAKAALLKYRISILLLQIQIVILVFLLVRWGWFAVTAAVMSALLDNGTSDGLDQHERPDEVEQL